MNNKIKTEDIVKSLRACAENRCSDCALYDAGVLSYACVVELIALAADRLEELAIFKKARITAKQPVKNSDEFVRQARLVDHWRDVDD